ncbi:hypothetical protein D3C87_1735710 [compost metagenome]
MTKNPCCGTLSTTLNFIEKEADVVGKVKLLVALGHYHFLRHARQRMRQRRVNIYELLQVLERCEHKTHRDRFSHQFQMWQYTVEGRTIDGRKIRLGLTFDEAKGAGARLLIVTVIPLQRAEEK